MASYRDRKKREFRREGEKDRMNPRSRGEEKSHSFVGRAPIKRRKREGKGGRWRAYTLTFSIC